MKKFFNSPIFAVNLLLIILFFLFWNLHKVDIQFWDEATNIGTIIESAKSSDWWNLKYAGDLFWEKPPLFYFLGVGIYRIFSSASLETITFFLRAISSLFSFFIVFLCWIFLKKKISLIAANLSLIAFLSVPILYLFSPTGILATHNFRSADSDILQLFFILLGYLTAEGLFGDFKKPANLILIGVFSGLAVMTKGVLGFLPLFLLILNTLILIRKKKLSLKEFIKILLYPAMTCLLIILPWHIYMYYHFGNDFLQEYFFYHQLGRAGSALEGHSQPIWFYFLNLLNPKFSGILLPLLLLFVFSKFKISKELAVGSGIILLFSLLQTKISWYILPAFPFLIIYISKEVEKILSDTKNIRLRIVGILILIYFALQIVSIGRNLINLPKGIQSCEETKQIFLTEKDFHRVFYVYALKNGSEIVLPHEIEKIEERTKQIIVDQNEVENTDKFGNISSFFSLTDNYSTALLEEQVNR